MTTLTITRDRLRDDLRPNDRITAIDGKALKHPMRVAGMGDLILVGDSGGIRLHNRLGTETVWNLYPDSQVETEVTVEREEPKPKPPKRPVSRTRHGLRLTYGIGWETQDGVFRIGPGEAFTECEHAHPMRWKDEKGRWHHGYCEGNQWHPYTVGWIIDGPGGYGLDEPHNTLDEAWQALAEALKKRGKL